MVFEKEGGEFGSLALVVHGMIFTPTRRVTFARENIIIIILSLKVTQQAFMILFCLVCHSSNEILSSAEALLVDKTGLLSDEIYCTCMSKVYPIQVTGDSTSLVFTRTVRSRSGVR